MDFISFINQTFYGNTIQQWAIFLFICLGAIVVAKIIYWISGSIIKKFTEKTETKLDDIIIDMIEEPIVVAIILFGVWYGVNTLILSDAVITWIGHVYIFLIIMNIAWLITRLFDAVFQEYILPFAEKTKTDFDDQLLPLLRRGFKSIVWILAIIVALNNAGYNVGALLAGLGIGGIALAMAAKDTIANIFGGITIFTDKPFKIKDRIKIAGFDGFVTEIGVRSTRIQTLEGTVVTIPNMRFSESAIENITLEPSRRVLLNLGLTYDTPVEKVEEAMKVLEEIGKNNTNLEEKILISFNKFESSSLNILFIYYIKKESNILQTQTEVSMAILKEFNARKIEFAFPTQTIYTKKG
jgi:MscS family membrane protein